MRGEEVVHDNKMDLASIGYLNAVKPVELGQESVGVFLDMVIILLENFAEKLMFAVMNGLDDVLVVSRKVEEASTLAGRPKLGKNVLAGEGYQVIGRIQPKRGSKMAEHPRCIVLEFEVVLGRWGELVSGSGKRISPRS
jgi:hypothetical protein